MWTRRIGIGKYTQKKLLKHLDTPNRLHFFHLLFLSVLLVDIVDVPQV